MGGKILPNDGETPWGFVLLPFRDDVVGLFLCPSAWAGEGERAEGMGKGRWLEERQEHGWS